MNSANANEGFLHRFLEVTRQFPKTLAINDIDNNEQLSYQQLKELAEQRKNTFRAAGVKPGTKVALLLPNSIEFVACYLALVSQQALPIIINNKLTRWEIGRLLDRGQPDFIITQPAFYLEQRALLAPPQNSWQILLCGETQSFPQQDGLKYLGDPLDIPPEPLNAPQDNPIVSLQFTWRGLGRPFPVAHSYLEMTHSTDGLHENFYPQGVGSVHLVTLPLYAIFGLSVMLVFPLSVGATLLITNSLLNRDLAEVLARYQVTFACLVPDVIRYFNARLAKRKSLPSGLHPQLMIYSGGGHLPASDAEKLSKLLGCGPVLQGYGLTESLPVLVQNTLGEQRRGAMGQAIRGAEICVLGPNGEKVQDGRIGELVVRGPMLAEGYYQDEEGSRLFFKQGWLHTGDLVWRDEQGHFFFVCQRLRISKIRAQMIDLHEIELVALRHPQVKRARAWVTPDKHEANVLSLSIELAHGQLVQNELLAFMGNYLSGFKIPRNIKILSVQGGEHVA
ncbi:class I adenylate-forming enzyme family protein [Serratia sp. (in: enterobacteria)]|uniref:class I adenylate-forming enzyme family protein n=1 Tax=Serratia sp. (in: enterobacteria) TaxID=616 RepID=UPI0039893022